MAIRERARGRLETVVRRRGIFLITLRDRSIEFLTEPGCVITL